MAINAKKIRLFDLEFDCFESISDAAMDILQFKKNDKLPLIFTPHVDYIVSLHKPEWKELRNELQRATYILPDGQPIVWYSRLKCSSKSLPTRITGSDLFSKLWNESIRLGLNVFLISPNVNVGNSFQEQYRNCDYFVPDYFAYNRPKEVEMVVNRVYNRLIKKKYSFVFVGIGFPRREILSIELVKRLQRVEKASVPYFGLFGAALEFHLGYQKRAPRLVQKIGMEWFYRFIHEPRRLFHRYFVNDIKIFSIALKELGRYQFRSRNKKRLNEE